MFEGLKKWWRMRRIEEASYRAEKEKERAEEDRTRRLRVRLMKVEIDSVRDSFEYNYISAIFNKARACDVPSCSVCGPVTLKLMLKERLPAKAVSYKETPLGTFCTNCGVSMEEEDNRNLFQILEAREEERNPSGVTQGILDNARHRVNLLEEEVNRKQRELNAARLRLQTLEAKPSLEAKTYRALPEKT